MTQTTTTAKETKSVSEVRIRCSRLGDVMTNSRDAITEIQLQAITDLGAKEKAGTITATQAGELKRLRAKRDKGPVLSDSCTKYLLELYIRHRYGRSKDIVNKFMEKGTQMEEDSFTLWSRIHGKPFFKNEQTYMDDDITGTPDLLEPKLVSDFKTAWDIFTFMEAKANPIDPGYAWQLRGYMRLRNLPKSRLIYTLIDTPDGLVNDEKRRLAWRMGLIDPDINEDYIKACAEIDKNSSYSDIPLKDRAHEKLLDRDVSLEAAITKRVHECRAYMLSTWPEFYVE